jgi:glycosyltransferase involved in cell wall biosynthesis
MKVAIVHDWLTGMRGGEKCLEVFCELFPEATIYTLLHLPGSVSPAIEDHKIETSFLQRLPFVSRRYRYYLPLFPRAAKLFQLQGYDLVLSSSHCVAKNVCVPPGACHISYVYTPMRYVWDQFDAYFGPGRASWAVRSAMRLIRPWLQTQDVAANDSVHHFVAISHHVARRIRRFYGRDAEVVHPPVDVDEFGPSAQDDGYFLMVTALAPYKRVDLAIEAFNQLGRPLKVIGSGQDEARLRRLAGPTVELLG